MRPLPTCTSPPLIPTAPENSCPRSLPTNRRVTMRRILAGLLTLGLPLAVVSPALAHQSTLEKIGQSGVLTIGTRTASPPFAFVNKQNEGAGFSIDLVEQGVKPAIDRN